MYVADHLVQRAEAVDFVPDVDPWPGGIERYVPYRQVTGSGVLGRPSLASHAKGKRVTERAVEAIVAEARSLFGEPSRGGS